MKMMKKMRTKKEKEEKVRGRWEQTRKKKKSWRL